VPVNNAGKFPEQDGRLDELDGKVNQLLDRFGGLEGKVAELDRTVRTLLGTWGKTIADTQDTVDEMEAKVDLIVRHLGIIKE
jgi:uncharacterized coiled-coil protein SlyX